MEWRAVAASLAEELGRPVIALDRTGRIRFVSHAAAELLGAPAGDLLARDLGELWVNPSAARHEAALAGTARTVEGELVAVDGRRLRVRAAVSVVIVEERINALLLRVESALAVASVPAGERRNLDYAVSIDPRDFGALVRLSGFAAADACAPGQRCWELVGRPEACPDCPLLHEREPWPRTTVRRRAGPEGGLELVQAQLLSPGVAEMSVRTVDDATFTRMFETRLSGIGEDAGLSPRETSVFRYLVMGRSLDDVATIMEISKRTVKHHQANLLRKLGADSRVDLVRFVM